MLVHRARDANDFLLDFFVEVPGQRYRQAVAHGGCRHPVRERRHDPAIPVGAPSCAVPGMVAGLAEAHRRYGTMPWAELVAPAAARARGGRRADRAAGAPPRFPRRCSRHDADGRRMYGTDERRAPGSGWSWRIWRKRWSSLAAEGARAFYEGELAARISDEVVARGGAISREDLPRIASSAGRPVRAVYRGHELVFEPAAVVGRRADRLRAAALRTSSGRAARRKRRGDCAARGDLARGDARARRAASLQTCFAAGLARPPARRRRDREGGGRCPGPGAVRPLPSPPGFPRPPTSASSTPAGTPLRSRRPPAAARVSSFRGPGSS